MDHSEILRGQLETLAQKLNSDESLQQQIVADPAGVLKTHGVSDEMVAAMQAQTPEVEGHGWHDSCWTWSSVKCGGGSSQPVRVNPSYNVGNVIAPGGANVIAPGGANARPR